MSIVIESASPLDVKPLSLPYALIEGVYDRLADNLWLNSKKHLIMHGTKGINVKDFQALLTEEDRNIMNCTCCSQFFRQNSNLLAVHEDGIVESALFRNVPTTNVHAKELFNRLADIIESGKPSHFVDERLRGFGHQSVKIILGTKKAGGFPHYHGFIARQGIAEKASFQDSVIAINNIMNKFQGLNKLAEAMEAITPAFIQEEEIAQTQRDYLASFTKIIVEVRDRKSTSQASTEHIMASLWAANYDGLSLLLHFNGNVIGNLIEFFMEHGDYERAVKAFLRNTDPAAYKARETAKVTKQQLEQTHKYVKEHGYGSALTHSIASPDDVESIWKTVPKETPAVPEQSAADVADDLFAEKLAEVTETKEAPKEIWPSANNITRTDFIHRVLKEASRIWLPLAHFEKLGIITTPTDQTAKPIFFWTAQRPERPYVTCIPEARIDVGIYGLTEGYQEIEQVSELPWYCEDIKMEGALSKGWMLCFAFDAVDNVSYYGLQSFGAALKGDLQPHRLGIDSVIENRQVHVREGKQGTAYLQLSNRWQFKNVRVLNKDGSQSTYNIMDVE